MTDSADIELIESLRLRFALASSDEQLQKLVTGLLVPLLDKFDITGAAVRPKIIGLLGQINKKLKGHPEVMLPTMSLLDSAFGKNESGFAQGFRLMYILMALEHAAESELVAAIPILLGGIHTRPNSQHATLVASLFTALWRCPLLSEDHMRELNLANDFQKAEVLVTLARDLFLFKTMAAGADGGASPVAMGLSADRQKVLTNGLKAPWTSDASVLQKLKLQLVHVVGSGVAFPTEMQTQIHEQRLLALLCASCDAYFQTVADRGKDALKRMRPVELESPTLVRSIFAMFLGGAQAENASDSRLPVAAAVRLKLLGYLGKSLLAAALYPQWARVVSESLFSASSTAKLRQHGMSFLLWAISKAPSDQITQASSASLDLIQRALTDGASSNAAASLSDDILRGSAYLALGTLAWRAPALTQDNLDQLQGMFEAFIKESTGVRLSIQEGLLVMLPAYDSRKMTELVRKQLLALLQKQLESQIYQARYCALRYAISVFPFAEISARWLCMLGLADTRPEIQQLARSGLAMQPSTILGHSSDLPDLKEAIIFIREKAGRIVDGSSTLSSSIKTQASATSLQVYGSMLDFFRSLLLAKGVASVKEEGELLVDYSDLEFVNGCSALASELQRKSMRIALAHLGGQGGTMNSFILPWLEVAGAGLNDAQLSNPEILSKSLMYVLEALSLGPLETALVFFDKRDLLFMRLASHSFEVQLLVAQLLSVIYAVKLLTDMQSDQGASISFWNDSVAGKLDGLIAAAQDPTQPKFIDSKQGSIITLGHILYGLWAAQKLLGKSWTDLGLAVLSEKLINAQRVIVDGIVTAASSTTHPTIAVAWCIAAGEVSKAGYLGNARQNIAAQTMATGISMLKADSTPRVYDAALTLVSDIVLGNPDMAAGLVESLATAAGTVTKKQLDVHFKTGEALARALGRFNCTFVTMDWVFPIEPGAVYDRNAVGACASGINALLETITAKLTKSSNMQERQAAAIWTLTLVQSCPGLDALGPWLAQLHACMSVLLSDRSELTQEVASRALGLIYNMGDASLREDMVYSLISLFGGGTGGSSRRPGVDGAAENVQQTLQRHIQSNEPLLEQESLGQTPDGHSVNTTYKSIMSLASDMQNPSLVYQFMQLATHTAMWNSRCGAAYGVANIIEQARGAIQPYMETMIPKLYRYTFDSSPQTQTAMKSIWNALLGPSSSRATAVASEEDLPTNGANVVERHWDAILEECLTSMGQREWKTRESGCNALAGAVSGADPELVVPYLDRIWKMSFRVLDDIKSSVRESGLKMCRSLATATVTWCTPQNTPSASRDKQAQAVVDAVIPFLVEKGVVSDSEDVRNFSMGLLLKLCKASGRYLEPFVPAISEKLIESLSDMESQAANYMTFHAGGSGISQDQLESLRLGAVKSSPMMQGVETILEYLTPSTMEALVPRLQNIIRHGLGLPARAGCARTVVVLCVKKAELVRPFASALVKAISGSLAENSALQRQAWAAAIGYMAPMLSPAMIKNLLKHLEKIYFEKYDSDIRGVSGQVLEQLSQKCPERLCENPSGPGTASFVLFGCSDASEVVANAFQSAWQEYILGLGNMLIEEQLAELLKQPLEHIAGENWPRRIQSAKVLAEIARMVERDARAGDAGQTNGSASSDNSPVPASIKTLAQTALPELVKASRGRRWPGKEHVLGALVSVCAACARALAANVDSDMQTLPGTVCDILLKEMRHGELPYRREVIKHYCTLMERMDLDVYSEMSGALLEMVEQMGSVGQKQGVSGDAMEIDDDDDDDTAMKRPQQLMLVSTAIKALQLTLAKSRRLLFKNVAKAADVLRNAAQNGVWNVRVASLECLAELLERCVALKLNNSMDGGSFPIDIAPLLDVVRLCAAEGKYVSVRTAALGTLGAALGAIEAASTNANSDARVAQWSLEASAVRELFLKDPVPSVSDRAKEL
ncbi:proteasome component M29 [Coemansia sp. RSA 988]|nr:proteasome component M29 [Coemansia sp. RSA 988]